MLPLWDKTKIIFFSLFCDIGEKINPGHGANVKSPLSKALLNVIPAKRKLIKIQKISFPQESRNNVGNGEDEAQQKFKISSLPFAVCRFVARFMSSQKRLIF